MKKPLVSVCICAYNCEKYIKDTLETVIKQTYKNLEILILDQNSSDSTFDILMEYQNKDSRIRVYSVIENIGAYNGLNYLIDRANGKYIAIQDHDDLWLYDKIEKQVAFLENNLDFVGCGTYARMWFEGDNIWYVSHLSKKYYYCIHPSLMFRNNHYRYVEGREYMADCYFMKKILCNGKRLIYNIPEILTIHRIRFGLNNYSYSWFKNRLMDYKTIFYCHNFFYGFLIVGFERCRKLFYPYLSLSSRYKFERFPFKILGYSFYNDTRWQYYFSY